MPKPKASTGEKNLISQRLIELRRQHNMSQRLLAYQLQLNGYDMDKNVITRIETNKRHVTDEKHSLRFSMFPMNISSTEKKSHSTPMWEAMTFFRRTFFRIFNIFLTFQKLHGMINE